MITCKSTLSTFVPDIFVKESMQRLQGRLSANLPKNSNVLILTMPVHKVDLPNQKTTIGVVDLANDLKNLFEENESSSSVFDYKGDLHHINNESFDCIAINLVLSNARFNMNLLYDYFRLLVHGGKLFFTVLGTKTMGNMKIINIDPDLVKLYNIPDLSSTISNLGGENIVLDKECISIEYNDEKLFSEEILPLYLDKSDGLTKKLFSEKIISNKAVSVDFEILYGYAKKTNAVKGSKVSIQVNNIVKAY